MGICQRLPFSPLAVKPNINDQVDRQWRLGDAAVEELQHLQPLPLNKDVVFCTVIPTVERWLELRYLTRVVIRAIEESGELATVIVFNVDNGTQNHQEALEVQKVVTVVSQDSEGGSSRPKEFLD